MYYLWSCISRLPSSSHALTASLLRIGVLIRLRLRMISCDSVYIIMHLQNMRIGKKYPCLMVHISNGTQYFPNQNHISSRHKLQPIINTSDTDICYKKSIVSASPNKKNPAWSNIYKWILFVVILILKMFSKPATRTLSMLSIINMVLNIQKNVSRNLTCSF